MNRPEFDKFKDLIGNMSYDDFSALPKDYSAAITVFVKKIMYENSNSSKIQGTPWVCPQCGVQTQDTCAKCGYKRVQ